MGIFNTKPKYEDVVYFVKHLSDLEYQKFIKVVRTYRGAEKTVKDVLGCNLADYPLEYEHTGDLPKTTKKKAGKK